MNNEDKMSDTAKSSQKDAPFTWTSQRELNIFQKAARFVWLWLMIHYLAWFPAGLLVLGFMYMLGYGWLALVLVLIYMPSFLDKSQYRGGRPWHWLRKLSIWQDVAGYSRMNFIREAELDPTRKYIFGYAPHGILILSRIASYGGMWERLFPGVETRGMSPSKKLTKSQAHSVFILATQYIVLAASPLFHWPGSREICLWMSAVDAGKKSAHTCLDQGKSLIIYPGGSYEIFHTRPDSKKNILVLKERKGFCKLALQKGADIVPTFVFGEKYAYRVWNIPEAMRTFLVKKMKVPILVFWGRFFSWMPFPAPMAIVFGRPIKVEQKCTPTQEEIDQLHSQYMKEIQRLFAQYKQQCGYDDDEELVIQ